MKTHQLTKYECEKCHQKYERESDAMECEAWPVTQDRGVKVGDVVRIIQGDGSGLDCKVTSVSIISRDWGHYAWKRYWHTVGITGDVIGSWGSRFLTFDAYEVIRRKETA